MTRNPKSTTNATAWIQPFDTSNSRRCAVTGARTGPSSRLPARAGAPTAQRLGCRRRRGRRLSPGTWITKFRTACTGRAGWLWSALTRPPPRGHPDRPPAQLSRRAGSRRVRLHIEDAATPGGALVPASGWMLVVPNSGRTAAGISLLLPSARGQAARDGAQRAVTPSDGGSCRQAVCARHGQRSELGGDGTGWPARSSQPGPGRDMVLVLPRAAGLRTRATGGPRGAAWRRRQGVKPLRATGRRPGERLASCCPGPDRCSRGSACDTYDNVSLTGLDQMSDAVAHAVMTRRALWPRLLVVLSSVALAAAVMSPAAGGSSKGGGPRLQGDQQAAADLDARRGRKAPSARQKAAARGTTIRWNRFGTPQVLTGDGGYLASGLASDPVAAARAWLAGNTALLGIDRAAVADLDLLASAPIGKGRAVLFRQRFGGLPAGHDGLVVVGVAAGKVAYVASSLAAGDLAGVASLSPAEAFRRAAASAGRSVGGVTRLGEQGGWTTLRADGFATPQRVQLVALPIPGAGAVPAYEAIVLDGAASEPLGASVFVDARNGDVLISESLVDDEGEPSWKVFPASPSPDYSSADTRQLWCWTDAAGCDRALDPSSPDLEWDVNPGAGSSFTTDGNNATGVHNWFSNNPFTVGTETATARPGRDYVYAWSNQWFEQRCNPDTTFTSAARNDVDAARANLFAMHNRMHDWSYHLGFTEQTFNLQKDNFGRGGLGNDNEQGNAQAGGVSGGPASGFAARDNANQITPPDGQAPTSTRWRS